MLRQEDTIPGAPGVLPCFLKLGQTLRRSIAIAVALFVAGAGGGVERIPLMSVVAILPACCIVWEPEAEAQLFTNLAKGHQVAPYGLIDAGESGGILSLSYGEVYIPAGGSHQH
ncbi:hypothetical protein F5Y12DRAFT_717894 [Xylaria sp. FL1777]|nr:hypothetical protein F5Y12DRAFT_717894 [Xylaria sp. FL1777]